MENPFPGMNPYLEAPSLWPDVHHELIAHIRDQLQGRLTSGYRAVITPYAVFESIEIAPVRRVVPDVAIVEHHLFEASASPVVAIETAPLSLPALMTVPVEYARIEIRTVRDQVLVTAIELLSPANKRPGLDGADAYEKKRQEIFSSTANLIEIDLLRAGIRPQVARPLPAMPYFIFLSRVQRRPIIEIWPLALQKEIPLIPIPLLYPDPPVALDLGSVIHEAYRRARYDLEINYNEAPPAPNLPNEEAIWLNTFLHEKGLRKAEG